MLILGFGGGPELIEETHLNLPHWMFHDSASVLLADGNLVCAMEEERLNRIKHTNKFPLQSLRFCLEKQGIQIKDVDAISYYKTTQELDSLFKMSFMSNSAQPQILDSLSAIRQILLKEFNHDVDPSRFHFVHHHVAHAMSTFVLSGYEESLITTFDGMGDGASGMIFNGSGTTIEPLKTFPVTKSLGAFYINIMALVGYRIFDEYKVMGLAPYGDPERFRHVFKQLYTLLPDGDYQLSHREKMETLFELGQPRRKGEPFTQKDKDIACALQESLEEIVFHVISHYQRETGHKNLCLAGGVAHNCTLNGKILRSGMFERVFVQPAAHDAGAALGAALHAHFKLNPAARKPTTMPHVYLGSDIATESLLEQLQKWNLFVSFEKLDDITRRSAELLADGAVIGWVQGCSEFGPRALGNRSILADPRPAENKDRINQMVKKREGYRPFAPSVMEEDAGEFFELSDGTKQFPYMIFIVTVKEDKRSLLQAVTHVDGTARIHTVARATNEPFWQLLRAFKELTGVPVLLNTSFNNYAEPIVDSIGDALNCYLTTGLDYLVIGDYLIRKRVLHLTDYLQLAVSLPVYVHLQQLLRPCQGSESRKSFSVRHNYNLEYNREVMPEVFDLLARADNEKTIAQLLNGKELDDAKVELILKELFGLWEQRLIQLTP